MYLKFISLPILFTILYPNSVVCGVKKLNSGIPDDFFNHPLLSQESIERPKAHKRTSTLLEPIIIHHKGIPKDKNPSSDGTCQGACIPPLSCDYHGGVAKGNCQSGTTCCQFERSCGGVSREKISFFRSPHYPILLNESLDCSYEVYPNEHTCGLRVEFLEFKIQKAAHSAKVEKCVSDFLFVLNTDQGFNEPLCEMENHTAIIFLRDGTTKPARFLLIAQSEEIKWNLKITQVNCKKLLPWTNEAKCGRQLMFEPGPEIGQEEGSKELGQNSQIQLSPYIVNGKDAESREFPWQISLQLKGKTAHHRCGGSILNKKYILTAAHCLMRNAYESKRKMKIVVGDYILNGTEEGAHEEFEIDSIIGHFHYKPSLSHVNDIAIIKIQGEITYSGTIQPICLPTYNYTTDGQDAWVSGWGRLNGSDPTAHASTLQKLKVKILEDSECKKAVQEEIQQILKRNVSDVEAGHSAVLGHVKTQLCARAKLSSAVCFGDSGGPLVIQREDDGSFVQVGVVSYGLGKCITKRNPPGAYTRVSEFLQFIAIATSNTV